MAKDRLDIALEQFEDETLDLSLGERMAILRDAMMWHAFKTILKVKKHGSKDPVSEDEHYKQEECMRQFSLMEKMYAAQVKNDKLLGKSQETSKSEFLKKVKSMKSSVGDIISVVPETKKPDGPE